MELKVDFEDPLTGMRTDVEDPDMRYRVTIKLKNALDSALANEEATLNGFVSLDDAIRGAEVALAQRPIGRYTYDVSDIDGRPVTLAWQIDASKANG